MSIPKIIHYCWFGREEKPELIKRCINSWNKNARDYEIKEWNEENFDINTNDFIKEAYANKKYAFVSDFVRVQVLYKYGGIYLDTDVELLKNFDEYLDDDSFWGFEAGNYIATSTIGAKKENRLIKLFLDEYSNKSFYKKDGTLNTTTNVEVVSNIFKSYGLTLDGKYKNIEGLASIYPMEVFSPYDYRYYEDLKNDRTIAIHHYYKSWISNRDKLKQFIKKIIIKVFGTDVIKNIYEK